MENENNSNKQLCIGEKEIPVKESVIEVFKLVFPLVFYSTILSLTDSFAYFFLKIKYPEKEQQLINSMGIINLYCEIFYVPIAFGLISGIDILCSNARGSKNYYLFGLYWHRGRIILFMFTLLFAIFSIFSGKDIIYFITNDSTIYINVPYMVINFIIYFSTALNELNNKYLYIFEYSEVILKIYSLNLVFQPLWNYIFINYNDLELIGVGISQLIAYLLTFILSSIYLKLYNPCPEAYFSLNRDCFKGIYSYFIFTIPNLMITIFSSLINQVQSVIALHISNTDFSAYLIGALVFTYINVITYGFSIAMTVIIGRMIVENSNEQLLKMAFIIRTSGNLISIVILAIFFFFKNQIFSLFIDENFEPLVFEKLQSCAIYFILIQLFSLQGSMTSALLNSLNLQKTTSIVYFISIYVIQLGVTLFLVFYLQIGVVGIWIGKLCGTFFYFVVCEIIFFRINLNEIKERINKRMEDDENEIKLD